MREAANLAEFREGHFPNMALYHTKDTHFDLLVANSSRLITSGLLGRARENKVEQESSHLQVEEWQTVTWRQGGRIEGQGSSQAIPGESLSCSECEVELESRGSLMPINIIMRKRDQNLNSIVMIVIWSVAPRKI